MHRRAEGALNSILGWLGLARSPAAREPVPPDSFVVPDATRCVQCGVCGYNCPVGIPVRDFAHRGQIVDDPACVQCGQCIEACPRGTLHWGRQPAPHLSPDLLGGALPADGGEDIWARFAASPSAGPQP